MVTSGIGASRTSNNRDRGYVDPSYRRRNRDRGWVIAYRLATVWRMGDDLRANQGHAAMNRRGTQRRVVGPVCWRDHVRERSSVVGTGARLRVSCSTRDVLGVGFVADAETATCSTRRPRPSVAGWRGCRLSCSGCRSVGHDHRLPGHVEWQFFSRMSGRRCAPRATARSVGANQRDERAADGLRTDHPSHGRRRLGGDNGGARSARRRKSWSSARSWAGDHMVLLGTTLTRSTPWLTGHVSRQRRTPAAHRGRDEDDAVLES